LVGIPSVPSTSQVFEFASHELENLDIPDPDQKAGPGEEKREEKKEKKEEEGRGKRKREGGG
jgi:hypothetical protein